jgi:hypothetical protein
MTVIDILTDLEQRGLIDRLRSISADGVRVVLGPPGTGRAAPLTHAEPATETPGQRTRRIRAELRADLPNAYLSDETED